MNLNSKTTYPQRKNIPRIASSDINSFKIYQKKQHIDTANTNKLRIDLDYTKHIDLSDEI